MHTAPLELVASRADRAGIFLDFDGSLSEIAPTPDVARPVEGATDLLAGLARRFAVVAVVSGRRRAEVTGLLGEPEGVRIFGLYGLDRGGEDVEAVAVAVSGEVLQQVREAADSVAGSIVEPKGATVAVHYRLSPDPAAAREALLGALGPVAGHAGLRLIEGKLVVELVPPTAPTKGDVVAREGSGLEAVLYAGDDLADLDAFAALDRLAASGALAVRVAVRSSEAPPGLLAAADLVVDGPRALLEILRGLLE